MWSVTIMHLFKSSLVFTEVHHHLCQSVLTVIGVVSLALYYTVTNNFHNMKATNNRQSLKQTPLSLKNTRFRTVHLLSGYNTLPFKCSHKVMFEYISC